jgi:prevent-host-death family protein
MTALTLSKAREELAEVVDRVADQDERIVIGRRGKPVAVLISMRDAEWLEAIEDYIDVEAARAALKEKGGMSLAAVRKKLGL